MATTYKTPGVYINEISTLPASVAQVETAIPAFIGFTESAKNLDGSGLTKIPKRIKSMVDFIQFFGGPAEPVGSFTSTTKTKPKVILSAAENYSVSEVQITMKYHLYYSMNAYFSNGGGPCYIVSVGDYDYSRANASFLSLIQGGIAAVEPEDEPTILLTPDSVSLPVGSLGTIQKDILKQCNKLQDRFGVFDLKENAALNNIGEADFRTQIGMQYLKYGAAYGPWLQTTLQHKVQYNDLKIVEKLLPGTDDVTMLNATAIGNINTAVADLTLIQAQIDANPLAAYDLVASNTKPNLVAKTTIIKVLANQIRGFFGALTSTDIDAKIIEKVSNTGSLSTIIRQAKAYDKAYPGTALGVFANADFGDLVAPIPTGTVAADFNYALGAASIIADPSIYGSGATAPLRVASATPFFRALLVEVLTILDVIKAEMERIIEMLEATFETVDPIYAKIKRAITNEGIVIPPSGAIAGIYAATDENRGVWKAPANVSLNSVTRPTIKIDHQTQENLNVHSTGKSVNIIRSFTGKGVLVWGARTLAGNDNEWRYVPVRRLFITMEESIKKATEFVVFEPNDKNTWVRTKTMVENYLTGLWRQGALAGAKPEDAFFVNVGLGETMTSQDVLEGKLIIEIGVAAVRPAEFIILKFSHKLQES